MPICMYYYKYLNVVISVIKDVLHNVRSSEGTMLTTNYI